MDLLDRLHPLIASIILLVLTSVISVGALVTLRRVHPHTKAAPNNEVAGFMFAVVGVIYAVILAFVFIVMWERHQHTEDIIEQEASSLGGMFREARAIPDKGPELRQHIYAYTELVLHDELKTMARGRPSDKAFAEYRAIWSVLLAIKPTTPAESNWHQAIIIHMNRIDDCRRIRLSRASYQAPSILWILVIVGALVTIGFSYLYGVKNLVVHSIMTAALACLIVLTMYAVYEFETPFSGSQQVITEPYERELGYFAIDFQEEGKTPPPPQVP